jgi:retrograde regulation protein 2
MAVFNPTAHLYHALVDIGRYVDSSNYFGGALCMLSATSCSSAADSLYIYSNGIRFSVTDLNIPTSRILPVVYQDRSAISLYDAQNDANGNKIPIPPTVIEQVIAALLRFKNTCRTFGVLDKNIKIVATEATRNATNRDDLLQQTQKTTGWTVDLLSKELEGRLGAMGIASSMEYVGGICIDMGGGSLQLTHVVTCPDGGIFPSPSVSYPYGAAALMKDMAELNDEEVMDLLSTITTDLKETMQVYLRDEQIQKATEDAGGFKLYLSGGGFRGWGHFLMSQKIGTLRHYPIPIVNGYTVDSATFFSNTFHYGTTIKSTSHRISHRRSSQIPAVQLVVEALSRTGIRISRVTFAQGGVREGLLYYGLPSSVRALAPVQSATITFAPPSAADFHDLLRSALPQDLINQGLILAVVNLLYAHEAASKDVRAVSALRCTTTGILASAHGLSHHGKAPFGVFLHSLVFLKTNLSSGIMGSYPKISRHVLSLNYSFKRSFADSETC